MYFDKNPNNPPINYAKRRKRRLFILLALFFLLAFSVWWFFYGGVLFKKAKIYAYVRLHHEEMEESAIAFHDAHEGIPRYMQEDWRDEKWRIFAYENASDISSDLYYNNWRMFLYDTAEGKYIVTFDMDGWGLAVSGYYTGAYYSPDDKDYFAGMEKVTGSEIATGKIADKWYWFKSEY